MKKWVFQFFNSSTFKITNEKTIKQKVDYHATDPIHLNFIHDSTILSNTKTSDIKAGCNFKVSEKSYFTKPLQSWSSSNPSDSTEPSIAIFNVDNNEALRFSCAFSTNQLW